ncbi:hypothetical protein D3C85_1264570 [compost metagenome]
MSSVNLSLGPTLQRAGNWLANCSGGVCAATANTRLEKPCNSAGSTLATRTPLGLDAKEMLWALRTSTSFSKACTSPINSLKERYGSRC